MYIVHVWSLDWTTKINDDPSDSSSNRKVQKDYADDTNRAEHTCAVLQGQGCDYRKLKICTGMERKKDTRKQRVL